MRDWREISFLRRAYLPAVRDEEFPEEGTSLLRLGGRQVEPRAIAVWRGYQQSSMLSKRHYLRRPAYNKDVSIVRPLRTRDMVTYTLRELRTESHERPSRLDTVIVGDHALQLLLGILFAGWPPRTRRT